MEIITKYQGKAVTRVELDFIRNLIAANPHLSRRQLSQKLCEAWDWRQPNGRLKDMLCRSYLLHLHRADYIQLPAVKCRPKNPLAQRQRPHPIAVATTPLLELPPDTKIELCQVRWTSTEALYNSLIEQYHYLRYHYPIGESLKYIFFIEGRPIACIGFSSAVRHLKCRDAFIGWSPQVRAAKLHLMAYNTRFLILPWISIPCLASRLLSQIAKRIAADWQHYYQHPVYYLETFVDPERFRGTCYQAANWKYLGLTTGRGKADHTRQPNRSLKAVWGYALVKNFRELLQR